MASKSRNDKTSLFTVIASILFRFKIGVYFNGRKAVVNLFASNTGYIAFGCGS